MLLVYSNLTQIQTLIFIQNYLRDSSGIIAPMMRPPKLKSKYARERKLHTVIFFFNLPSCMFKRQKEETSNLANIQHLTGFKWYLPA